MELEIPLIKGVIKNFSQIIQHSVEAIFKQVVVEAQVCIPYYHPQKAKPDLFYCETFQLMAFQGGSDLGTRTISKGKNSIIDSVVMQRFSQCLSNI